MIPRKAGAPSVLDNLVGAAIPATPPAPTTPEKGVVNKSEAIPPKPAILPLKTAEIPAELRSLDAWVGWQQTWDGKRWTKVPVNEDWRTGRERQPHNLV